MALFLIEEPEGVAGKTRVGDAVAQLVEADSAAVAREIASSGREFDSSWSDSDATDVSTLSAADMEGFLYQIRLAEPAVGGALVASVDYEAVASDAVDDVGAALVILLNGLSPIANAAYDSGTNTLTVSGAADGLGDYALTVKVTPPGGSSPITGLVGTVADQGAAGNPVTVVLPQPTAVPKVIKVFDRK